MPGTESFTPLQLLELRSEMEEHFALQLRSMTNGQPNDASSVNDPWSPKGPTDSDGLDAVRHDRTPARLAAITAALRRVETGDFGKCARCGSRISFDRLVEMPEVTLCIACDET